MLRFQAWPVPPTPALVERWADFNATNPFCTAQFIDARIRVGERAYFLTLCDGDNLAAGCLGLLRGGFLGRRLQIPSMPILPNADPFWQGVWQFCLDSGVWNLQVDTYAAPEGKIPSLPGETSRRERLEYVLDLGKKNLRADVSSNHRRNIARAEKAGLTIRRTHDLADCSKHVSLMTASLERRARRDEQVGLDDHSALAFALLTSGAGELFLALDGDEALSSLLVLRSRSGAYYQSAGTSPRGMEVGASPFLICSVAGLLRQQGLQSFNLGGASPESTGLRRFKEGFGAREVKLEAASFCPRPALQRQLRAALGTLREKQKNTKRLAKSLLTSVGSLF